MGSNKTILSEIYEDFATEYLGVDLEDYLEFVGYKLPESDEKYENEYSMSY